MTYEQEEHERDLYEEARAEQQHAVAYSERENANLHRTVERLTAALKEIKKGEGPISRDRLTHANNTIAHMMLIAEQALGGE